VNIAKRLVEQLAREAKRIEHKFSRYRDDNVVFEINNSSGKTIQVDVETALLLDYADQCFQLSDGAFDITSGVLRSLWRFDGSDNVPSRQAVQRLLQRVGWEKVEWNKPLLTLQTGMELDFGGIGKEYAVDRAALIAREMGQHEVLINFGGDLVALGPWGKERNAWEVLIEPISVSEQPIKITLKQGALATSGDTKRFLLKDGIRYGHILDPRTGFPNTQSPHSVTVHSNTCLEAGMLATMAMLQGSEAKEFLEAQDVDFWIYA
jgi:thiamine biosynthesis lipoprotein